MGRVPEGSADRERAADIPKLCCELLSGPAHLDERGEVGLDSLLDRRDLQLHLQRLVVHCVDLRLVRRHRLEDFDGCDLLSAAEALGKGVLCIGHLLGDVLLVVALGRRRLPAHLVRLLVEVVRLTNSERASA